jgi:hypothetical protein
MTESKRKAREYSISKGYHPDAKRTSHAAKNVTEAFIAGYEQKVTDEKLSVLSQCYIMLSEMESMFPRTSKHRVKLHLDRSMINLLEKIKELRELK